MSHLSFALRHHFHMPLQGFRRLRPPRLPPTVATSIGHTTLRDLRVHTPATFSRPSLRLSRDDPAQVYPPLCFDSVYGISIPLHRRGRIRRQLLDHLTAVSLCAVSALLSMPFYSTPGNYFIM